jgi:hypothetical protein
MLRRWRRNDTFESRIVWIFGSPRSGSTWLWGMLKEVDRIVAINEPLIGMYLSPFASDVPGVRPSSLDLSTFTVRRIQAGHPDQFFADAYAEVWRPLLRDLLNERFRAQAMRVRSDVPLNEVVVAVKEPNGSQSADIIMATQPTAKLLFLLRDGRDVVDSELEGSAEGAWTSENFPGVVGVPAERRLDHAELSAYKWLWRTAIVQEAFDRHPGPKLLVRYEELRFEPQAQLSRLLHWLGIDVTADDVRTIVERHAFETIPEENRGATRFHRAATPGLWRRNMTEEEQSLLARILGPKLEELGYPA